MAAGGILVTVWAQSPTPTRLPAEQPFHHTHPILPCHALHNRFVVALPTILHALWERHSMEQQADPLAPPQKQNFHMQAFREAISAIRRLPVPAGPPEETRAVTAKSRCEWKQKRLKFSIRITCLMKRWSARPAFHLWNTCRHCWAALPRNWGGLEGCSGSKAATWHCSAPTWIARQPLWYNVFLYSNINVHKYLHTAFHKRSGSTM